MFTARDVETADWGAPSFPCGDALLFDEPGRVLVLKPVGNYDVCYRAYWFRVTRGQYGRATLRVKHGGGEESWSLPGELTKVLAALDSDQRFFVLYAFMDAHGKSAQAARQAEAAKWRQAAAEKRIKTRKLPRQSAVKVWIEPAAVIA